MQTHEMENRFFTATQNAWVLGVVSVVVLMHSVFFSKISRGTDINSYDVGCMTTMLAFSALLVQYTTERALGRLCAVGPMDDPQRPDEIQTCELQLVSDNLSADYTFFGNLGAILLALLVSDVLVCLLHARLLRIVESHSTLQHTRSFVLVLLHAVFALVPCAVYVLTLFAVLEYTMPSHLSYLYAVGLMLAFSCMRRVWTAQSHRAQHIAALGKGGAPDEPFEVADVVHKQADAQVAHKHSPRVAEAKLHATQGRAFSGSLSSTACAAPF